MKPSRIVLFSLLLISAFVLLAGCNSNTDASKALSLKDKQSNGFVTISQNNLDLGDIPIFGGKVTTKFSFRNDGDEALVILDGVSSCMCTEAQIKASVLSPKIVMPGHGGSISPIDEVFEPGEEAELIATFDPLAHGPNALGPIMRDITLRTTSSKTPQVKFVFQGNVTQ